MASPMSILYQQWQVPLFIELLPRVSTHADAQHLRIFVGVNAKFVHYSREAVVIASIASAELGVIRIIELVRYHIPRVREYLVSNVILGLYTKRAYMAAPDFFQARKTKLLKLALVTAGITESCRLEQSTKVLWALF